MRDLAQKFTPDQILNMTLYYFLAMYSDTFCFEDEDVRRLTPQEYSKFVPATHKNWRAK